MVAEENYIDFGEDYTVVGEGDCRAPGMWVAGCSAPGMRVANCNAPGRKVAGCN
jgi:hypothetical protein